MIISRVFLDDIGSFDFNGFQNVTHKNDQIYRRKQINSLCLVKSYFKVQNLARKKCLAFQNLENLGQFWQLLMKQDFRDSPST